MCCGIWYTVREDAGPQKIEASATVEVRNKSARLIFQRLARIGCVAS